MWADQIHHSPGRKSMACCDGSEAKHCNRTNNEKRSVTNERRARMGSLAPIHQIRARAERLGREAPTMSHCSLTIELVGSHQRASKTSIVHCGSQRGSLLCTYIVGRLGVSEGQTWLGADAYPERLEHVMLLKQDPMYNNGRHQQDSYHTRYRDTIRSQLSLRSEAKPYRWPWSLDLLRSHRCNDHNAGGRKHPHAEQ